MMRKKLGPGRIIALGFIVVIAVGTLLLSLPVSWEGEVTVSPVDALFTATSAVCVTGLSVFDPGDTLSLFGEAVLLLLIQTGGLGIATIAVGLFTFSGRKIGLQDRALVREAFNTVTNKGILTLLKKIFLITACVEGLGAILSFFAFRRYYSVGKALRLSIFHAVSSFNNAGFDIWGDGQSLEKFNSDALLYAVTGVLIILGTLGFFVIQEIITVHSWKKFRLHTKIVLFMTAVLLAGGTVLIKLAEKENISWLDAAFSSITARTAGFAAVPYSTFSGAGLLVMMCLMFIGGSPGGTAGGVKTTTIFALFTALRASSTNSQTNAFGKKIQSDIIYKAFVIVAMGFAVVITVTGALMYIHPELPLKDVLFEVVSAFATVGLSTGITASFSAAGKIILVITMFIGRIGSLSIATLWVTHRNDGITRPEEKIPIG